MKVDSTPSVYSVMCIPPNTNGAGPRGHVAIVTAIEVLACVVTEMNFLIPHGYDFGRTARTAGCEFIHLTSAPVPAPDPPSIEGATDMVIIYHFAGGKGDYYRVGALLCPLADITDENNLIAACNTAHVPVVVWNNVSLAQYANERIACTQPF